MRLSFLIAFVLVFLSPFATTAQSLDGSLGITDSFTVSVNPQYPTPNSQAALSFLSSTLDLTNAVMAVSVGGKQTYKGSVRPIAVPLGGAGSVTSIVVTITSGDTQYRQSLAIQPQDVSLIAEPVASAPALYLGKPLIPLEGNVRVVAMANVRDAAGKIVNPANLSYLWTVDGARIANSSGIGKSVVIVASPLQYRERPVSVTIQSQNGSLVGGSNLSLVSSEPSVRIYENDPLLGIRFNRALSGTHDISRTEATLYAAPFSMSILDGAPLLQWFLNGAPAQTGNSITLRPAGSGQGDASLSLTAKAGASTMATANLFLSFGAAKSSNFFGL